MESKSISIIVLVHNQCGHTKKLLATLAPWLEANPQSELIIIDNGSTDDTKRVVFESGIPASQIKYFYNEKNLGVAPGRNIGLKNASKDLILFLDNDTEVGPAAIDALREYLLSHCDCGLCAPRLVSPLGEVQDSAKPFPGLTIKLRHLLCGSRRSKSERESMASRYPFYVIGACQMFRKEIIAQVGMLDEKIFYGPEDADWCMRIRRQGLTVDYLPEIQIIHHWQRTTKRSPFSLLSLLHIKSLFYFYRKHRRMLR